MDANPYHPPQHCEQPSCYADDQANYQLNMLTLHAACIGYGLRALVFPTGHVSSMAYVVTLSINVLSLIVLRHIIKLTRQR